MSSTDTILVIVNARARHQAGLAKGAVLAQMFGARLALFAWSDASQASGPLAPMSEVAIGLEELARPLRDSGLEVATAAVFSDSFNASLAHQLQGRNTRFVIKDVVASTLSRQAELTHTDWQLARACPVPLLLSKSKLWSEQPLICAAIDPWHEDDRFESSDGLIMAQGAMLAERVRGQLHVLHAYIPPTFVIASPGPAERAIELAQGLMSAPANARLRELRSFTFGYQLPVAQVHLLIGPAREALSGYTAQLGADVVVMGAVSRAALRREVIGGTAEGLLKRIGCDVLVVKGPSCATTLH